jgi:hypothetical protein
MGERGLFLRYKNQRGLGDSFVIFFLSKFYFAVKGGFKKHLKKPVEPPLFCGAPGGGGGVAVSVVMPLGEGAAAATTDCSGVQVSTRARRESQREDSDPTHPTFQQGEHKQSHAVNTIEKRGKAIKTCQLGIKISSLYYLQF